MTRSEFLNKLRGGLTGLPFETINEICTDYESHFTDGKDAGRTEAEVAAALGDPKRLAKELRAEAGLKRWEEERNPSSAAAAVLAVLGLATIDVVFLLPLLLAVGGILLGLFVAAVAIFIAGVTMLTSAIVGGRPMSVDPMTVSLAALGLMSLGIAIAALLVPTVVGLLNVLGRYGRLHYRLLQPALENKA
jgi:uncharacterized membrane protein